MYYTVLSDAFIKYCLYCYLYSTHSLYFSEDVEIYIISCNKIYLIQIFKIINILFFVSLKGITLTFYET